MNGIAIKVCLSKVQKSFDDCGVLFTKCRAAVERGEVGEFRSGLIISKEKLSDIDSVLFYLVENGKITAYLSKDFEIGLKEYNKGNERLCLKVKDLCEVSNEDLSNWNVLSGVDEKSILDLLKTANSRVNRFYWWC